MERSTASCQRAYAASAAARSPAGSKRSVELPGLAEVVGGVPDARRRGRPGTPHRARSSRRSAAARPRRRAGRPGAGRAGRWRRRRRRRAAERTSAPASSSSTSRTSKAIASSVARTRWARVVPRVRPMIVPRACGSQCGAPSPVSAGTKTTPSEESTVAAMASVSAAEPTICEPVAQPLHGGAGHEDRALERVGELAVGRAPGGRREQARRPSARASVPVLVRMNEPVP